MIGSVPSPIAMRITLPALLAASFLAALPGRRADAQEAKEVSGDYDVKYDEVANNCTDTGMNLARGTVKLSIKGKDNIVVDIERMPVMSGSISKSRKFKAASKLERTSIQGLDGKFSSAGRVDDGVLQIVLIAEYYVDKKPLCTQSWNVSGVRK
jgi:hypothetical protein